MFALLLYIFFIDNSLLVDDRQEAEHIPSTKTNKNNPQKMLLGIVFVCLSGGYVFGFLSIINKQGIVYEKYIEEEGEHIRSRVWNIGLQSIKERPWFGYGLENFEHTYQKHLNASMIENKNDLRMVTLRETLWFDMVHNTTLESLVYNGVIGTLTKILLLGIVLFLCMRRYFQKREFY